MTVGNHTWASGAVPLRGESEIEQLTAATDILTITGAASQSGDFLVCRNSSGTEKFVVDKDGDVSAATLTVTGILAAGVVQTLDNGTTAPTTAELTVDGQMAVAVVGTTPRLYFRVGDAIKYADGA